MICSNTPFRAANRSQTPSLRAPFARLKSVVFAFMVLAGLLVMTAASRAATPVISSGTVASARTGLAFNFIITASNTPTSYSATGLPAGLTFDTNLGVISGTPTAIGTSTITLGATNSSGTGTSTLVLTVISDLAKAADVGWLQQMDASNFTFYDNDGQMKDPNPTINCLKILRARNIDTIRLRVFVPPITEANWDNQLAGHCTAPEIVVVAAKAQALGFRILIDLHYSWTFADPGNQRIPTGWANEIVGLSTADAITKIASEVTAHTTDVLTQLKAAGVTPEWVQVGNEITNGMLSESQNDTNQPAIGEPFGYFPSLVTFINAGYNAVKAVDPNIKVVVHIDRAHSDAVDKGFFTSLKNDGGKWDVSGTDFSGGTYSDTTFTMNDLSTSFNAPGQGGAGVMMCEVEPPNIYSGSTYNPNPNFDMVTNILNIMRAIPGKRGLGVVYWEAEADPDWRGYLQSAFTNEEPSSALDSMRPSILQASGTNIINATGQTVQLKGVNLGGYMVMEPAITPADKSGLPDEYSIVQNLDARFGVPTEQSLITTFRQNWITSSDIDKIKAQGMNLMRVPVWWGDFYPLAALDTKTVAITSPTTATGTIGSAFSYVVTATNSPTSFSASTVPAGLSFNTSTGVLSGTPTTAAKTTITLQATGSGGTGTEILTLTVNTPVAGTPVISNSTANVSVSSSSPTVSYQIAGSNSPTAFSTSTLPGGLSLNSTTGLINGTLSPSTPAIYDLTITATNATGSNSTNLSLVVTGASPTNAAPVLRSDAFTVLDSIIETAAERGIYTVIDLHGAFGGQSLSENTGYAGQNQFWSSTTNQANTQAMWTAIAAHYRGYAWVAGYDVLNEPTGASSNQAVVAQLSSLYTTVRAADPDHIIFMQGTGGSMGWEQLPNPASVGWTNVVYEMHEYERTNTTAGSVKAGADSQVTDFKNNKSYNVPAYIGEFNGLGTGTPVLNYVVNDFNNAGMNWSAWTFKTTDASNTDGAGLYKPTGTAPAVPNILTDSNSTISTDWGNWTTAKAFALDTMTPTALIGPSTITSLTQGKYSSGSPFSYTITASDVPTSFTATGLPGGLTVNATTGVISGTPTAVSSTTVYNVAMSAATSGGTTTGTLRLKLTPPIPVITGNTTDTATTGKAYSYQIVASNGANSFTTSTLPAGLSLNIYSGLISGTPTTTGVTNITLNASNSYGSASSTLTLTVNAPPVKPVINSATTATGTAGVVFTYTITAANAPTTYNATSLPAGLSVSTTTGVISGTPTALGVFQVALSAGNAAGTATATLSLTVNAASTTPLIWTGATSQVWDATTANWSNGSAAATYADTDPVTFDDTGSGGTITWSGAYNPSSVTVNASSKTYTLSGILGGSLTLTKNGTSTLNVYGVNTYTGGTLLTNGGLYIAESTSALGTGMVTLGSVGDANTLVLRAKSGNPANLIVVNAGGTRWLEPGDGNGITYTGGVVLNGGATLSFATGGGNLTESGGVTGTGNILLGENGGTRGSTETLSGGAINNTGTISDAGNPDTGGAFVSAAIGTNVTGLVQGSTTEAMTLSGVNTFNGPITISAGSLTVGGAGVLGNGTFTGAISNAGTLLYNSSANQSWGGAISGTGTLVDSGTGTLTLAGSDSYSGATTVNAGALNVTGNISSSAVYVAPLAMLTGTGTTGSVTVANGATINLQDGKIGTLTVGGLAIGNATLPSVIALDIQTVSGVTSVDEIIDTGILNLIGTQGTTINIGNLNGTSTLVTGANVVPLLTYTGAQQSLGNIVLSSTSLDGEVLSLSQSGDTIYLNIATPATVTLGNLTATYNGSPQAATATTSPAGLAVTFTYNGNSTAPTATGSYQVIGTISDPNYVGSAMGALVISQGSATVTLSGLAATFNGSAQPVTVTTNPPGLNTTVTYNGSSTAPSAVGSYTVNVTVTDPNYQGAGTGTLVISSAANVSSDSPTMPQWALILLAGLLIYCVASDKKAGLALGLVNSD